MLATHEERHREPEKRKISFLKIVLIFFCRRRRRFFVVVRMAAVAGIFSFLATDTSHRCFLAPQSGFFIKR